MAIFVFFFFSFYIILIVGAYTYKCPFKYANVIQMNKYNMCKKKCFYRTIKLKKKIVINVFYLKISSLTFDHRFTGHPEHRKRIFRIFINDK